MGKCPGSVTSSGRSGRSAAAASSAVNNCTLVESPATVCPGAAPMSVPMVSPTRSGACHQPAAFQEPMSAVPHWRRTTSSRAAGTAAGSGPRELPSR